MFLSNLKKLLAKDKAPHHSIQKNEQTISKSKIPKDPVERNLEGQKLEKMGLTENAIEYYLANVHDQFDGNYPYNRLATIYRKRKLYNKEIEILEKAIWVFENKVYKNRGDRLPKLEKFKHRLNKAIQLRNSN
jgi:tetratricopeptide (TPR) repeat protein